MTTNKKTNKDINTTEIIAMGGLFTALTAPFSVPIAMATGAADVLDVAILCTGEADNFLPVVVAGGRDGRTSMAMAAGAGVQNAAILRAGGVCNSFCVAVTGGGIGTNGNHISPAILAYTGYNCVAGAGCSLHNGVVFTIVILLPGKCSAVVQALAFLPCVLTAGIIDRGTDHFILVIAKGFFPNFRGCAG